MKPLQIQYNNVEQQWWKTAERKKSFFELACTEDPEQFKMVSSVLIDTNKLLTLSVMNQPKLK